MSITMLQLLEKINEELEHASGALSAQQEEQMRDRLVAIKTLCELALNQPVKTVTTSSVFPQSMVAATVNQPQRVLETAKRVSTEDGANGPSIFDF